MRPSTPKHLPGVGWASRPPRGTRSSPTARVQWQGHTRLSASLALLCSFAVSWAAAQSPFAAAVIEYAPAPGQFVNDPLFNNASAAVGRPYAGGFDDPGNSSLVTLGGFGGSLVLAFDHTVLDDAANPFGLDAIVYGNAFWVSGNPNRRWAEPAVIEISRDVNGNGLADDAWFLIPGSHLSAPGVPWATQTWDDAWADATWPPADPDWLPPGAAGVWATSGWLLPPAVFGTFVIENPHGPAATTEGIYGYADCSPTLKLGDTNGDNLIDDPLATPEDFYTRPDNPFRVGLTPGCGGGDAFDIAWAVDPATGAPAQLDGFDFLRLRTAVNLVVMSPPLGESSPEIDAVADVRPGRLGDTENDGDVDLEDWALLRGCWNGPGQPIPSSPCRIVDMEQDADADLADFAAFQGVFGS